MFRPEIVGLRIGPAETGIARPGPAGAEPGAPTWAANVYADRGASRTGPFPEGERRVAAAASDIENVVAGFERPPLHRSLAKGPG